MYATVETNTPEAIKAQHIANFFPASISINNRLLEDILPEYEGNETDFENATLENINKSGTNQFSVSLASPERR